MTITDQFLSSFLKATLMVIFIFTLTSCGERTRLDTDSSSDEQGSQSEDPQFRFSSGGLHYDQNSKHLILSSWINDRINSKVLYYEYIVDLSTQNFVFLKNQAPATGGQVDCLRQSAGVCVELKVNFPGLDKMVSAQLGSVEIEQTESGTKTQSPVFLVNWPRTSWKNNDLPWIHYAEMDPNAIGYLELTNYNTDGYTILPGALDLDKEFYNAACKTSLLTSTNFEVICDYREKMTNLKTSRKWNVQFIF